MPTIELSILRGIPVLQDLDEQDLQALVKRARIKTFANEEVIYEEGEPCNSLWIMLNGAVRLLTTAENDGHEIVTASPLLHRGLSGCRGRQCVHDLSQRPQGQPQDRLQLGDVMGGVVIRIPL